MTKTTLVICIVVSPLLLVVAAVAHGHGYDGYALLLFGAWLALVLTMARRMLRDFPPDSQADPEQINAALWAEMERAEALRLEITNRTAQAIANTGGIVRR